MALRVAGDKIGGEIVDTTIVQELRQLGALLIYVQDQYFNGNNQKEKIAYVPLDPVVDYLYIADLNNRLHVSWKTQPNLNFNLRFQN